MPFLDTRVNLLKAMHDESKAIATLADQSWTTNGKTDFTQV